MNSVVQARTLLDPGNLHEVADIGLPGEGS
jgi:hypothetical protein